MVLLYDDDAMNTALIPMSQSIEKKSLSDSIADSVPIVEVVVAS